MNAIQILGLVLVGIVLAATANRNRLGFVNKPREKRTRDTPITCEICGNIFDTLHDYMSHECPKKQVE
jgi:hypothetical protein